MINKFIRCRFNIHRESLSKFDYTKAAGNMNFINSYFTAYV